MGWLQSMVTCPAQHHRTIAAVWGKLGFEEEPTINCDGFPADHANPWAKQYQRDFESICSLEEGLDPLSARQQEPR